MLAKADCFGREAAGYARRMDGEHGWSHYAPLDGPPKDLKCSFCGVGDPAPGWTISPVAAICPKCATRAARFAQDRPPEGVEQETETE